MHIESVGQGRDLVLIHGWAMHSGIFAPLTRLLAQQFRVHLVDLPGHGRSHADGEFDPATCAATLTAALPRALWIGWSLGGLVALYAALDHADKVCGLVGISSSPRFVLDADWPHGVARSVFAEFDAGLRRDYRGTIERFLALEALGSEHAQSELRELKLHVFEHGEPARLVLEQGLRVLDSADLRARLADVCMPSLWLGGRRDRLVPVAAMRWAAQHCAQGRFVEFSAGHAPFIGHATQVADAIIEFSAGIDA